MLIRIAALICLAMPALASQTHGSLRVCRPGGGVVSITDHQDIIIPAGTHYIQALGDHLGATAVTDTAATIRRGAKCATMAATADQPVQTGTTLLFSGSGVIGVGDTHAVASGFR